MGGHTSSQYIVSLLGIVPEANLQAQWFLALIDHQELVEPPASGLTQIEKDLDLVEPSGQVAADQNSLNP